MRQKFLSKWQVMPNKVRKPIVLTVGMLFVLAAGATGWLPGPGGIPLFLIGIAILATEYSWAERLKNFTLKWVTRISAWLRERPILMVAAIVILAGITVAFYYLASSFIAELRTA